MRVEKLITKIRKEVKPIYLSSPHYKLFIWRHVLRVSRHAKGFVLKIGADRLIAEAGGLLHDIGAAKFGKENHHVTGVQEASLILLKCGCPLQLIGSILTGIYSHRGSQRIAFQTLEAKCIAAGDALEHFTNLEELWRVQIEDLHIPESKVFSTLDAKLARDWQKIDPEIKPFLNGIYARACRKLVCLASRKKLKK